MPKPLVARRLCWGVNLFTRHNTLEPALHMPRPIKLYVPCPHVLTLSGKCGRILPSVFPTYRTSPTWIAVNVDVQKKGSVGGCKTGVPPPQRVVSYMKVPYAQTPIDEGPKIFRKGYMAEPVHQNETRSVRSELLGAMPIATTILSVTTTAEDCPTASRRQDGGSQPNLTRWMLPRSALTAKR